MKFRTEIEIRPFPPEARIGYDSRIFALGSCFASEMALRLGRLKFDCTVNPAGVLFNPASVASALRAFRSETPVRGDELREADGIWFHFGFHGSFADTDPAEALRRMNGARHRGAEALRRATHLLLTFGTAWVYEHEGRIVANCHRRPAAEFVRRRLSVAEIADEYDALLKELPDTLQVIVSVSPVRHTADGLEGNCASKAVLRLAAEELATRHPNVCYFPAYEILTDDLRDYRFYADDLVHPAPQAVEYVWERFAEAILDDRARRTAGAVERIVEAAAHRPRLPRSEAWRAFCRRQLEAIEAMPGIDWSEERARFAHYLQLK